MRPLCSAIFGSDRRQPAFDPLSFHDSPPRHGSTLRRLRQPINHGSYGISGMFGLPCNTQGYRRKLVPDDHAATSHVSLRVPQDIIEAFDHLAATLDRPRSWVMLRALRQYLDEEGAEIAEDIESLAELDRGEVVSPEELHRSVKKIIAKAEKTRAQHK